MLWLKFLPLNISIIVEDKTYLKEPNWTEYGTVFHHVLVYMGNLKFEKGTISKFDDILLLPHVLPLAEGYPRTPDSSEGLIPRAIICYMGIDP